MADLFPKPDPNAFRPGATRLKAADLQAIVRAVVRQIRGGSEVNTQYFGDRVLIQSHHINTDLPDPTFHIMEFVVLEEHPEGNYLICSPFIQPNNDQHQWITQSYDPDLNQDSKVIVSVAKPYHLQVNPWSDEPVVQTQDDEETKPIYLNDMSTDQRVVEVQVGVEDIDQWDNEIIDYEQVQRITPGYMPGDIITAIRTTTGLQERKKKPKLSDKDPTEYESTGDIILWMDLNVAARKWEIPQYPDVHTFKQTGDSPECWYTVGDTTGNVFDELGANFDPPDSGLVSGILAIPLWTGTGGVIDRMGFFFAKAASAGAKVQLGIYNAPNKFRGDLMPVDLLCKTKVFAVDDTGILGPNIDSVEAVLGPGLSWGVIKFVEGSFSAPTIREVVGNGVGTYSFSNFISITALVPGGETVVSEILPFEFFNVSSITVSWNAYPNATGYKIYLGGNPTGGSGGFSELWYPLATVGLVTSYTFSGFVFTSPPPPVPDSKYGPPFAYPVIGCGTYNGYCPFGYAEDFGLAIKPGDGFDDTTSGEFTGVNYGAPIITNGQRYGLHVNHSEGFDLPSQWPGSATIVGPQLSLGLGGEGVTPNIFIHWKETRLK